MHTITTDGADRARQTRLDNRSEVSASRRLHWKVIAAVFVVSFLTILARVGISGAKADMARDLRISDVTFGVVFGAFALGYAVFMVPCGWLADRWGPRRSLSLSVFFWSSFTLCTGLVTGVGTLIGVRFLFGLAEAGVFPQATRALHNWTLPRERGLALGLLNMGSRLGAAFGLAIIPVSAKLLGWRLSFILLGFIGMIWAVIWFCWFRDGSAASSAASQPPISCDPGQNAPAAKSTAILWRRFLSSRNFYLITYQYFASQFTFFICLSWLLPFATTHYGITVGKAGMYSSIPLYCGALAMWSGGMMVDQIYKTGRWKLSRGLPPMIGFALATATMLPAPFMHSIGWFIACFALTTFGLDLTVSASWTVCCDVGREYSGTLSAAMNTAGALGSVASALLFPVLVGWAGNITAYFSAAAILNLIALVCWWYIEPAKPVFFEGQMESLRVSSEFRKR
jgi:ACS family glucarate transporter-like MFS transporter